jgi:hypothetical protein
MPMPTLFGAKLFGWKPADFRSTDKVKKRILISGISWL